LPRAVVRDAGLAGRASAGERGAVGRAKRRAARGDSGARGAETATQEFRRRGMSAAEPPQGANSAPSGGSEAAEPRAWGEHTRGFADAARIVVKVGSSLVTNEGRGIDH